MDEQLITISIDEPFEPLVAEEMLRSVVPVSYTHLTLPTSDLV